MTMPIEDPNLLRSILGKTQMVSQIAFFKAWRFVIASLRSRGECASMDPDRAP